MVGKDNENTLCCLLIKPTREELVFDISLNFFDNPKSYSGGYKQMNNEWYDWFFSIRFSSKSKSLLEGTFFVAWWNIWRIRNRIIFEGVLPRRSEQWARVKLLLPVVVGAKDTTEANTEIVRQTFSTKDGETKSVHTEGESSHQRTCVNVLLPVVCDTKSQPSKIDRLTDALIIQIPLSTTMKKYARL
nr:RNA-directed DNA polymerase, eukaryota [Tanacetum cinerariifolium]